MDHHRGPIDGIVHSQGPGMGHRDTINFAAESCDRFDEAATFIQ